MLENIKFVSRKERVDVNLKKCQDLYRSTVSYRQKTNKPTLLPIYFLPNS